MPHRIITQTLFAAATVLLLAVGARAYTPEPAPSTRPANTLSESDQKAGWVLLFDGKSTAGWRNYKKDAVDPHWVVEDGAIIRKGGGGDIMTKQEFASFDLYIEYRVPTASNSGILFHVSEDQPTTWMTGPEVQILDNGKGADPQLAGFLYQLYKPAIDPKTSKPLDATNPVGEWNAVRLIVDGDHWECWMNGVKYWECENGSDDFKARLAKSKFASMPKYNKNASGHIALQGDHGDVAFRNIKLRVLDQPATRPAQEH